MIYYYDDRAGDDLVIEDTSREIDRLCNMADIAINESFDDTILGKIINLIKNLIKWIFDKIKEIFEAIGRFFKKESFERKAASVDPRTVERGKRVIPYYDTELIQKDFKKKYDMLKKSINYYKSKFVPLINAYSSEKLKQLAADIDLNDIASDITNGNSDVGVYLSKNDFPNPYFGEMKNKIEDKEEPYYKKKELDYYQVQDIIEQAKKHSGKTYWEYLGIKHPDIKFDETINKELDSFTKEFEVYSKKIESNKEKCKEDDKFTYKNLERITASILKQIKDAAVIISKKLIAEYNTYKQSDNFFTVSSTPKDESAYIQEARDFLDSEYNEFEYLSEAYIGKTKTLLEIEEQVGVVREKALKKFTDINKSPEVLKLNRLVEKQFGMDCFCLSIIQEDSTNAFTEVVQGRFDIAFARNISKYVEGNNVNGFRWKKGNGLCIDVSIYLGVLRDETFTNAEIVAILLHEIGHNFADAIYDDIKYANTYAMYCEGLFLIYYSIYMLILSIIDGELGTGPLQRYLSQVNSYRMAKGKSKFYNIFRGFINGWNGTRQDIMNFISGVITRVIYSGKLYKRYKDSLDMMGYKELVKKSTGRQNEVIADKFAGIYGYGPEQASALLKLTDRKSYAEIFMERSSIFAKFNEAFKLATLDINNYDVHPHNIQRAYEEIKLLERELKKADCDPKKKEIIQNQIDQIKEIINETIKVRKNTNNYEKQKAAYYKLINDKYPDAITDELENKIEEALDKALSGGK